MEKGIECCIGFGYEPVNWQWREEIVETSVLEKMQQLGKRNIDDSFIGTRIEYLYEFDLVGEGNTKALCWCGRVVENISDGTWVNPGKRRQCYKENESAFFLGCSS